jgi:hypothetical protein
VNNVDPSQLYEDARTALIEDECGLSFFVFEDNFSELRLLHNTIEDLIAREESTEIENVAREAGPPEQRGGAFWAEHHPYWWDHIIAPQFRGSFFVALLSAVELHLGRFADDAGTIVRAPIGADDLKGGFYQRTQRFLRLFCLIQKPTRQGWDRLGHFYAVRNTIVHRGSHVGNDSQGRRIQRFANEAEGLVIDTGHLELTRRFCEVALGDCRNFLNEVRGEIVLLCRQAAAAERKT